MESLLLSFAGGLAGLIFGLAPALQSTRTDIAPTLKDQAGGIVGGNGGQVRLRKMLVAVQVMLLLVLLVGAGLFIRMAFNVDPSLNAYNVQKCKAFYRTLVDSVNSIPGVRSIGLYGVMAFTVARRTREIGIRMALGALQSQVIWMVMREVLLLIGIGVVAGLAAFAMASVACAAGDTPVLRASRVEAVQALRYE